MGLTTPARHVPSRTPSQGLVKGEKGSSDDRKFSTDCRVIAATHSVPTFWFETRRCAMLLTMRSDKVRVARIGAPHGVHGEVKLWSFTQDPMAAANYGPLQTQDGARQVEIEALRPGKNFLVARIAGIADRAAAEGLRNLDLYVSRERLPPIVEADTFYHADLIGLAAVTADGEALGTISAIHNFGAGDLIEIARAAGGELLLLPFNDATVPMIDLKTRRVVVVPPAETEARDE
jgi:16S rRNA processing protein RimM